MKRREGGEGRGRVKRREGGGEREEREKKGVERRRGMNSKHKACKTCFFSGPLGGKFPPKQ